jgi:pimeloyl-ACP methyl ester carboxylesterase
MAIESEETSVSPVQEQMIDVGGHKVYFRSAGEGSPVVILESGTGGTTETNYWLEQEIAKFTRVCTYDRTGLGRSELDRNWLGYRNSSQRLHMLLEKAMVEGPYIMVGHSLGGVLIRDFTKEYPNEVVGLVFIDSSHPLQIKRMPKNMLVFSRFFIFLLRFPWLAKIMAKKMFAKEVVALPPEVQAELNKSYFSDKHFKALRAEYEDAERLFNSTADVGPLGDRPIAVFTADLPKSRYQEIWYELQDQTAALSTNSTHEIVKGSSHIGLITHREYALKIAATVHKMIEDLRPVV